MAAAKEVISGVRALDRDLPSEEFEGSRRVARLGGNAVDEHGAAVAGKRNTDVADGGDAGGLDDHVIAVTIG
jgi:hypothetical protein